MPCVFECVHNSCETGMKLPNFDMPPNARMNTGQFVLKNIAHLPKDEPEQERSLLDECGHEKRKSHAITMNIRNGP